MGDYAGQELFLLEGDSLLLHCFSDPRLDFTDGFQMLHAAYAVEHLVQGLVQRKCNLQIVFFDEHESLCVPRNTSKSNAPKYLLARAAIIRHLGTNLQAAHPSIELHVFDSVKSQKFVDFLKALGVYFVMCHDGANVIPLAEDPDIQNQPADMINAIEQQEVSRRSLLRTMICFLINQGYNVALINGLEWQDTKVNSCLLVSNSIKPLSHY